MEIVYALGYLFICLFIGFIISSKLYTFYQILIGHIIVLFLSAVFFSGGNTIALFFLPLFGFLIYQRNSASFDILFDKNKKLQYDLFVIFSLFILCFLAKYIVFYNFKYEIENIPTGDHLTYMSIAENFYLRGNENTYTVKNLLFNLNFNTPYRYHETWLAAIFLHITKLKTVTIFELILWPINYFLVSYTVYFTIVSKFLQANFVFKIIISFLFIFFTLNFTLDYSNQAFYFGVNGFPKLCINFVFLSLFFYFYLNQNILLSLVSVFALLILSSSSLHLIPFAILVSFFNFKNLNKTGLLFFYTFILLFLAYYIVNLYSEFLFIERQKIGMELFLYLKRYFGILYILKNYIFYLSLIIILIYFLRYSKIKIMHPVFYFISFSFIAGAVTYGILNFIFHDAVQLFSNIANVAVIIIIFTLLIMIIENSKSLKKYLSVLFFTYMLFCLFFTYKNEKFINNSSSISQYSKQFVHNSVDQLNKNVKNKIGIFIPVDSIGGHTEIYDYRQYRGFLSIANRNYELINIFSNYWDDDSFKKVIDKHKSYKYQYFNAFNKSAINIFRYKYDLNDDEYLQEKFIKHYKIEYAVTKLPLEKLPWFVNKRIENVINDSVSGINLIILDPYK